MNYKIFIISFIGLVLSSKAQTQKKFSEGTISYDIVINTGTDKPQNADFFDGATSAVYIKGPKSRTDMVSSLGTQSTIIDDTRDNIVILKEFGEQKYMINLTPQNWIDANKKYDGVTFTYDPNET